MADVNHVILIGRLTRDSELKYTSGGMAVNKFAIAVNKRKKKGESWVEEASFFDIILWGRAAETLQQYLVKGKQVAVEGELHQNRWESEGQTYSKIEIMARNVQLLGGNAGNAGNTGNTGNSGAAGHHANNQAPQTSQEGHAWGKRAADASRDQNTGTGAGIPTGNNDPGQSDLGYGDDMSIPPDFPDDIPF